MTKILSSCVSASVIVLTPLVFIKLVAELDLTVLYMFNIFTAYISVLAWVLSVSGVAYFITTKDKQND